MPLVDKLLSIVAPHDCVVCGEEGSLLCGWCAPDAFPALPSRCYRCKQLTKDSAVCVACRKRVALRHVWVRTAYERTAKDLLRLYKFERTRDGSLPIARAMSDALPYMRPSVVIVPVPTATNRTRERGYDHAFLLARAVAQERGLTWARAVTRLSQSRQVGASRKQRLVQLRDAFAVTKPALIKDMDVVLVDDVVTTGATLEAMAQALKQADARSISAVVFAQKQ